MDELIDGVASEGAEGLADPMDVVDDSLGGDPPADNSGAEPAEVEAPPSPDVPNDVWKASRLRSEREAQNRIDKAYREMYEGHVNPYSGKPILTERDYKEYQSAYSAEMRNQELSKAGLSKDLLDSIIEENPIVRAAQRVIEEQSMQRGEQDLKAKVAEIGQLDPRIKTIDDLFKLPEAERFNELVVSRGYDLVDAFKLVQFEALTKSKEKAAQNEAVRLMQLNGAATPGSLGQHAKENAVDYDSMTDEQFEAVIAKAKRGELQI